MEMRVVTTAIQSDGVLAVTLVLSKDGAKAERVYRLSAGTHDAAFLAALASRDLDRLLDASTQVQLDTLSKALTPGTVLPYVDPPDKTPDPIQVARSAFAATYDRLTRLIRAQAAGVPVEQGDLDGLRAAVNSDYKPGYEDLL